MVKRAKSSAAGVPEAILPLTDFRGDPWETGDKNAVSFRAGILSSPVPAEFAQKMRAEGKAAPRAAVTNLDGSPVARDADGGISGEPLNLTDEERAALPRLDPNASNDPSNNAEGIAPAPSRTLPTKDES
jgi:hypothetical protein